MAIELNSYSPDVLIYLEVGEKRIRLADVLHDSAKLYDRIELPANTRAEIVFVIGNHEQREDIILHEGIVEGAQFISFSPSTLETETVFDFCQ